MQNSAATMDRANQPPAVAIIIIIVIRHLVIIGDLSRIIICNLLLSAPLLQTITGSSALNQRFAPPTTTHPFADVVNTRPRASTA